MMRTYYKTGFFLFIAAVMSSCAGQPKKAEDKTADSVKKDQPHVVGGDKDEHGCIGSAGYTWSVIKNDCIRLFEKGIRLNPIKEGETQTISAFIVFSDDKTQAELFLPDTKGSTILKRQGAEGNYSWESGDLKLFPWKGYVLKKGDKPIYGGEEKMEQK